MFLHGTSFRPVCTVLIGGFITAQVSSRFWLAARSGSSSCPEVLPPQGQDGEESLMPILGTATDHHDTPGSLLSGRSSSNCSVL